MSQTQSAWPGSVAARLALSVMILCATAAAASTIVWGAGRELPAHAAHVLTVRDEGHLRFVRASGSQLLDEGRVSGSLPGWVKVRFVYNGEPTVSARFTISASGGSISARASGRLSSPVSYTHLRAH